MDIFEKYGDVIARANADIGRIADRKLERYDLEHIFLEAAKYITADRVHPFLIEAGMPLSAKDLKLLSRMLRPWLQAWYKNTVKGKSYTQALHKHVQAAKSIMLTALGKQKKDQFLKWAEYCWPVGVAYPGDADWDDLLYHLVHYSKPMAKLPRPLYRNRDLRKRIEQLYILFEEEKKDFEKRLKRHMRTSAPPSEWEKFLRDECNMRQEMKKPSQIMVVYNHLAFCRFWKSLNESLTPSDFAILKEWVTREAGNSYNQVENLDLVNCKCLSSLTQ